MNSLILCADDYGQNLPISQAIINLILKNRLTATSCLTNFQHWPFIGKRLIDYRAKLDIGLHFNLTEGKPLSEALKDSHGFLGLHKLILKAYQGKLDIKAIRAEFLAQLNAFQECLGMPPSFIDGHQHIHQLPQIREMLVSELPGLMKQPYYVRSTFQGKHRKRLARRFFKNRLIQWLGSKSLQRHLKNHRIAHNSYFTGVYDFNSVHPYRDLFRGFLTEIQSISNAQTLIMCHPSKEGSEDLIAKARLAEYQYLNGEHFLEDCAEFKVKLSRFNYE